MAHAPLTAADVARWETFGADLTALDTPIETYRMEYASSPRWHTDHTCAVACGYSHLPENRVETSTRSLREVITGGYCILCVLRTPGPGLDHWFQTLRAIGANLDTAAALADSPHGKALLDAGWRASEAITNRPDTVADLFAHAHAHARARAQRTLVDRWDDLVEVLARTGRVEQVRFRHLPVRLDRPLADAYVEGRPLDAWRDTVPAVVADLEAGDPTVEIVAGRATWSSGRARTIVTARYAPDGGHWVAALPADVASLLDGPDLQWAGPGTADVAKVARALTDDGFENLADAIAAARILV